MIKRFTASGVCLLLSAGLAASAADPPITSVAFAPNGESVVAASQSGVHVFDWPGLKRLRTIEASAANLHSLAFSPDGKHLAVGGGNPAEDGGVQVYAWPTGEPVSTFRGHQDSVRSVAWLDESQLVTASLDREIKLWDLGKPGQVVASFNGHSRSVDAICVLRDGKTFVSTGVDQSLRVWDLQAGRLVRRLNQHTKPVHALALRPVEGGLPMIASASGDRTIRLWQPTIGRMVRYVRLDAEPLDAAWLNGGAVIAAACVDGRVRLVDAEEVKVIQNMAAIDGWAYAIAVHQTDGTLVVGGSNGQIRRLEFSDSS